MRIGINLLYLIPGYVGGTETYAVQLLRALATIDQENEYYLFLNQECAEFQIVDAPNFKSVITKLNASSRIMRLIWEQTLFPLQLRKYKIDIVHSLGYVTPFFPPCGNIVTIHDTNYVAIRDALPLGKKLFFPFFVKHSALNADRVIADSEFSKSEIVKHTGVGSDKVTTLHLAERDKQFLEVNWTDLASIYNLQKPYFLVFGSVAPHKNLSRLLEVYLRLNNDIDHHFVLVGHVPPDVDLNDYQEMMNRSYSRLIATGYVPNEHILPLLAHADWFVFPSLYEGFGLPILEAQQCGVPVLASTAGSLPEVAGDSAEFFDPYSVEDMVETLQRCLSDDPLRQKLIAKGYENLKRFSWQDTAQKLLQLYQSVYESHNK